MLGVNVPIKGRGEEEPLAVGAVHPGARARPPHVRQGHVGGLAGGLAGGPQDPGGGGGGRGGGGGVGGSHSRPGNRMKRNKQETKLRQYNYLEQAAAPLSPGAC